MLFVANQYPFHIHASNATGMEMDAVEKIGYEVQARKNNTHDGKAALETLSRRKTKSPRETKERHKFF